MASAMAGMVVDVLVEAAMVVTRVVTPAVVDVVAAMEVSLVEVEGW